MNKEPDEHANQRVPGESGPRKKPYQKPAFRHERVFETTALACGKIVTTQEQCKTLPLAS